MKELRDMNGREITGALVDAFKGKRPDDDISVLMEVGARLHMLEVVEQQLRDALYELSEIKMRNS